MIYALLPDIANLTFIFYREHVLEHDARVVASRILHSPIVSIVLLILTRGRAWPYALHWVCDFATHPKRHTLWPFIIK